jgi:hypothetical protein
MTATAPAQERYGRPSPRHGADRLLCGILAPLLEGTPAIPAWDERAWRAAFSRPHRAPGLADALADRRLQPLMAWVASQVPPSRHLGAAAASLVVLGAALQRAEHDPYRLGAEVEAAVRGARPLPGRARPQARTSPSAHMDRHAAPDLRATAPAGSPFLPVAMALLRRAGHELPRGPRFAGRLAAALDVALAHWTTGSRPGGRGSWESAHLSRPRGCWPTGTRSSAA